MQQPDTRLFRQIMGLRCVIIATMLVAYTVAWLLAWSVQFAVMSGILAGEAILGAILFYALVPKRNALFVHLSLLMDTVASTGLIMCTGYAGSPFPLFYVLIVLAGGLLYGQTSAVVYLVIVSLANVLVLVQDHLDPLKIYRIARARPPYYIMGAAMPLVAVQMLLVVKLTQRGRYLQTLYENVSDALLVLDDVGRIVDANPSAAQMTGLARQELIGRTLESLAVVEGDRATINQQLCRSMAGEAVSFEVSIARPAGEPLRVELNAQIVAGLSPVLIQAFARDISARRSMEAEIRRQNTELRRINQELQAGRDLALNASRLKSQFLANMSHELRTPLNSIIGYTQYVLGDRERPLAEDQREDLGRVLSSGRHLLELINGVLDLARIESGRESVSVSRFDAGDLIDSVIDSVMPMAKQKGLELDCRVEGGLPRLETDANKLRQILLNLLANAVRFTEGGSVRILCERADGDSVRIAIADTGIGIPADQVNEIFNEFHQVDSSIHKRYGGTGLGLAIARRLAELLKGTIRVESVPGTGSTFTTVVPIWLERVGMDS